ncbi:GatB/GatE catalytic domain-containing protein [Auriculariales sp. MPI-PUGE-AT-0066]|nr:GatB/GatE catalytic domain-containing protein [Auriculariales sp. MPI-PUGE-AT-0066]
MHPGLVSQLSLEPSHSVSVGLRGEWNTVIGIEVHAQLKTRYKLFSGAVTRVCWTPPLTEQVAADTPIARLTNAPNTHVSLFDAAFPGTLPVLNPQCVEAAVRAAVALDADVQPKSTFDRKHYFYPDLPAGYQITQKYAPYALGGSLLLQKTQKKVRLKQLQIEQDTGKSHADASTGGHAIDLNRANSALVEIVSEPDMRSVASSEEAADFVRSLQLLLRTVGVSNAQMEDGSMRCDVNVSVHRTGDQWGTRCEIKNLNSVRSLTVAINYEVQRQQQLLESGQVVRQETRGFDEDHIETYSLRSKEDAPDYRYLPDSNLPPIIIDSMYIDRIEQTMPELPAALTHRLHMEYSLNEKSAAALVALDMKMVSAEHVAALSELVRSGDITYAVGRKVLDELLSRPVGTSSPADIVQELGLVKVDSADELETWCLHESAAFKNGTERVIGKMVGYVRRLSQGRADPSAIESTLRRLLK